MGIQRMDIKQGKSFQMLPPPPGACPVCAVHHDPNWPHNRDSLYYQFWFFQQWGRSPTWTDAMAHCPVELREQWRQQLIEIHKEKGLDVPADLH